MNTNLLAAAVALFTLTAACAAPTDPPQPQPDEPTGSTREALMKASDQVSGIGWMCTDWETGGGGVCSCTTNCSAMLSACFNRGPVAKYSCTTTGCTCVYSNAAGTF